MCPASRGDTDAAVGPFSMVKRLVPEELWTIVEPLPPPEPPKPNGGRPRVPDRAALAGKIYVLKSGIPWGMIPRGLAFGSGVRCWRRLRNWQRPVCGVACTACCWTNWTKPD
jgi:transposase